MKIKLIVACGTFALAVSFATAPGPSYAGSLSECVTILENARTCLENDGATPITANNMNFPANELQCTILLDDGVGLDARFIILAQAVGFLGNPFDREFKCVVIIEQSGCNRLEQSTDLDRMDYAIWATIARAECRAAL